MVMIISTPSWALRLKAKYRPVRAGKRRSSLSLLETIKKLESYHRDFFLVFAHVEARAAVGRVDEGVLPNWQNEFFRRRTLAFRRYARTTSSKTGTNPAD
jgi:hypothetical protein